MVAVAGFRIGLLLLVGMLGLRTAYSLFTDVPPLPVALTHPDCAYPCWSGIEMGMSVLEVQGMLSAIGAEYELKRYSGTDANLLFDVDGVGGLFRVFDDHVSGFVVREELCVRDVLLAHAPVRVFEVAPDGSFALYYPEYAMVFTGKGSTVTATTVRSTRQTGTNPTGAASLNVNRWQRADRYFRQACP